MASLPSNPDETDLRDYGGFRLNILSIIRKSLKETVAEDIKHCIEKFPGPYTAGNRAITVRLMADLTKIYTETGIARVEKTIDALREGEESGSLRETLVLGLTKAFRRYGNRMEGGGTFYDDNFEACQSIFETVRDVLGKGGWGMMDGTEGVDDTESEESGTESEADGDENEVTVLGDEVGVAGETVEEVKKQ